MVFIVGTPALAFSPGLDEAQQNTVVGGVVVDKNNEPLIGVSVMVEGSSGGTITNMDGKFSISLPKNKTSLKFLLCRFRHPDSFGKEQERGTRSDARRFAATGRSSCGGLWCAAEISFVRFGDKSQYGRYRRRSYPSSGSGACWVRWYWCADSEHHFRGGSRSGYIHSRYFFIQCQQQSADYRRRLPGERRS